MYKICDIKNTVREDIDSMPQICFSSSIETNIYVMDWIYVLVSKNVFLLSMYLEYCVDAIYIVYKNLILLVYEN